MTGRELPARQPEYACDWGDVPASDLRGHHHGGTPAPTRTADGDSSVTGQHWPLANAGSHYQRRCLHLSDQGQSTVVPARCLAGSDTDGTGRLPSTTQPSTGRKPSTLVRCRVAVTCTFVSGISLELEDELVVTQRRAPSAWCWWTTPRLRSSHSGTRVVQAGRPSGAHDRPDAATATVARRPQHRLSMVLPVAPMEPHRLRHPVSLSTLAVTEGRVMGGLDPSGWLHATITE
jgi:hypothetical protein